MTLPNLNVQVSTKLVLLIPGVPNACTQGSLLGNFEIADASSDQSQAFRTCRHDAAKV